MQNRNLGIIVLALLMLGISCCAATAKGQNPHNANLRRCSHIRVAASTATLADIANYIGGDRVHVTPLTRGDQAAAQSCTSTLNALRKATVLVRLGSTYDPWTQELVNESGNLRLIAGTDGDIDCSLGISGLDRTTGGYYWLDPENGKTIAANISAGLKKASPKDAAYFDANYEGFCRKIDENLPRWQSKLAPLKGVKVVSCCNGWSHFRDRFGLAEAAAGTDNPALKLTGEPRARLAITEPAHMSKFAEAAASTGNIKLIEMPSAVGSKGIRDYFALFERQSNLISNALGNSSKDM